MSNYRLKCRHCHHVYTSYYSNGDCPSCTRSGGGSNTTILETITDIAIGAAVGYVGMEIASSVVDSVSSWFD